LFVKQSFSELATMKKRKYFIIECVFFIIFSFFIRIKSVFPGTTLDQSIVVYLPFNGNANDESGNQYTTSVVGAGTTLTTDRYGRPNRAFHFSGATSYIQVNYKSGLDIATSDFTLSAWFMLDVDSANMRIFSHGHWSCTKGYALRTDHANGFSAMLSCGDSDGQPCITDSASVPFSAGVWNHVVGTWRRGGAAIVYFNGKAVYQSSTQVPTCDISNGEPVYIGHHPSGDQFAGSIDEVLIHSRALTAAEVQQLYYYDSLFPGTTLGQSVVAYLPFKGNAEDESGYYHKTYVVGASLTTDRYGEPNRAFHFSGSGSSSFIKIAWDTTLEIGFSDFSVSAWIMLDRNTTNMRIVSHGYSFCSTGYFFRTDVGGILADVICSGGGCNSATLSPFKLSTGVWYHVVNTYHRGTGGSIMYVNGVSVYQNPNVISSCDISNGQPLFIGRSPQGDQFYGSIDDVLIHRRALSAAEVLQLYNYESLFQKDTEYESLGNGLVGYFPFNGNARDESGNNIATTIFGATLTTDRFGASNRAYYFDGNTGYIVTAANPFLEIGSSNYSIAAWINLEFGGDAFIYNHAIDDCEKGYRLAISPGNASMASLRSQFTCPTDTNCGSPFNRNTDPILKIGKWYFVVTTVQRGSTSAVGGAGMFYVNGNRVLRVNNIKNCDLSSNSQGYIGTDFNGHYFRGKIDDLMIYNRVLSPNEILSLYNADSSFATNVPFPVSAPNTFSFSCTKSIQNLTVPLGMNHMYVDLYGAASGSGGTGNQGRGARVQSYFAVTPGTLLYVTVGCQGAMSSTATACCTGGTDLTNDPVYFNPNGGFNGGGPGYGAGTGGGGATDIRIGGLDLQSRVIIAGGGGGYCFADLGCPSLQSGGHGGKFGGIGSMCSPATSVWRPGTGGTWSSGGLGGARINPYGPPSKNGTLGFGGKGGFGQSGGGGGGYYGGNSCREKMCFFVF
jgi:hypothetical protein